MIVLIFGFSVGMIIAHIYGMSNDFLLGEKELREINPHLIYYIFLPLLIFDSAFNSRFHVIRPQIISAILLAGPGVLISIAIVLTCNPIKMNTKQFKRIIKISQTAYPKIRLRDD